MSETEERAQRFKTLAEEKFSVSSFKSSLKYATKAHHLCPNLEGMSEMLTALKILVTTENAKKSESVPMNWYEILQMEPFSHINTIRKQYKKLALALHPDKSTCLASEEAFKIVNEAFYVLSDKSLRKETDLKLQICMQSRAMKILRIKSEDLGTFWTACTTCRLFHEFERQYIGRKLMCPNCKKYFLAIEIKDAAQTNHDDNKSMGGRVSSNLNRSSNEGGVRTSKRNNNVYDSVEKIPVEKKRRTKLEQTSLQSKVLEKEKREDLLTKLRSESATRRAGICDFSKDNSKEKKNDITLVGFMLESLKKKRKKLEVSVKKNVKDLSRGDNDILEKVSKLNRRKLSSGKSDIGEFSEDSNPKKTKKVGEKTLTEMQLEGKRKSTKLKLEEVREEDKMGIHQNSDMIAMMVEDSDLYDFDQDRAEHSFKGGQVWAIYDDDGGMPRHYGLIDEVISINPFEVKMSWLNLYKNREEILMSENSGRHISCGKFKIGKKIVIESVNIFSHLVNCERVAKELYNIYPQKGTVWALYKEEPFVKSTNGIRSYDIVLILTSYSEKHGLSMAFLEKVKGFKTIFTRREIGYHAIKLVERGQMDPFSHQIPSRKVLDFDTHNLPKDSWELDPASLPQNLLAILEREEEKRTGKEKMICL